MECSGDVVKIPETKREEEEPYPNVLYSFPINSPNPPSSIIGNVDIVLMGGRLPPLC